MNLSASPSSSANPAPISLIPWRAQPGPQLDAIRKCWIDELLFGGSVFGGKSDFLLGDFAQDVPTEYGPHWHGILFRKTYPQLEELISRSKEIYPGWFGLDLSKAWSASTKTWTWPNGATLKMRFMESDDDWQQYWGHAFTWIGWDELALWASPVPYMRMKARLRSAHAIPHKRIRASANPGGPGHHWVKHYFAIDRQPLGSELLEPDDGSGMRRMFVRSRLTDNRIGLANDPGYSARLEGVGAPELVRALRDGDWNIVAGAYFPEFEVRRHVISPFTIPTHWTRLRAMDWGSSAPFSIGWYAVSDGTVSVPWHGWPGERAGEPLTLPAGALVKYREWYGHDPKRAGQRDAGLKLTAEEVADGVLAREAGEKIDTAVLDPSAFAHDGGPSIAERMGTRGVYWAHADNTRVGTRGAMGGWDLVRQRLKGLDYPMLYFTTACPDIIRTLPALQHDPNRIEDADTDGEDHGCDELRYAVASRPWVREAPKPPERKFEHSNDLSIRELIGRQRRMRRGDYP
jgi:hypothetical protein